VYVSLRERESVCVSQSMAPKFERLLIDWCCFYYFVRNGVVALLEALCARILSFRFVIIGGFLIFSPPLIFFIFFYTKNLDNHLYSSAESEWRLWMCMCICVFLDLPKMQHMWLEKFVVQMIYSATAAAVKGVAALFGVFLHQLDICTRTRRNDDFT